MNNDAAGILILILILAGFTIYFIRLVISRHNKKKTKNNIIYQDNKHHALKYHDISTYKDIPFHDFQYVYYLLFLIDQLPQDQEYQLRNNGMIINGKYSLEIYHDFEKLIGYKKFLDMYNNQIKNEVEYLYALLFELDVDKLDLYPQLMMPAYHPTYTSR